MEKQGEMTSEPYHTLSAFKQAELQQENEALRATIKSLCEFLDDISYRPDDIVNEVEEVLEKARRAL